MDRRGEVRNKTNALLLVHGISLDRRGGLKIGQQPLIPIAQCLSSLYSIAKLCTGFHYKLINIWNFQPVFEIVY
jgi:hypothetical protein